jgi:hypothetical protein
LLYGYENVQDVFVQDCHNFLCLLQGCPSQQIESDHGVAQDGNCLVVSLDKDLRFAVLRIPNHKTAIAALSFFLCHAMQYRSLSRLDQIRPLDSFGILRGVLDAAWQRSKDRSPGSLVFTNARGGPMNRRNLLRRQLKPTIKKLGLPASVDFRSFRTMHSSLMSSIGVRPEVRRDNMGHANVDVTQNVYNRTWWEERVEAVSMAAATVWREFLAQPVPATRM